MSRKIVRILAILGVVLFLLMGKAYTYASGTQRGLSYSSGIIVDGEYKAIDSGTLGGNSERAEKFNSGATIFYAWGILWCCLCWNIFRTKEKIKI